MLLLHDLLHGIGALQVRKLTPPGTDESYRAEVTCLAAASSASPRIAVGYADGVIRVYDFVSGTLVVVLAGHRKAVSALRFSAGGTRLASGSRDTDVILWDVVAETGLARFRGHRDEVTDVAFAGANDRLLFSGSKDTLVKAWDTVAHACLQTVVGTRSEVWSLAVVPAGDRLLVGAGDNQLYVFSVARDEEEATARAMAHSAEASAGGGTPAASSSPPFLPLTLLGSCTRQSSDRVAHVRCSTDGLHLGVQSAGKLIEVFRRRSLVETRKRVQRRLRRHREKLGKRSKLSSEADAEALEVSAGGEDTSAGSVLLAGTSLADVDALLARMEAEAERERTAAGIVYSTLDAARAAAAGRAAHSPFVIASDEWEAVGILSGGHRIASFAFLPPGGGSSDAAAPLQLAVSTHDNRVEFYSLLRQATTSAASPLAANAATVTLQSGAIVPAGSLSRSFSQSGHRSDVRAVAVSSDGAMLLSASTGSAKVWNAKTGACLRTLEFPPLAAASVAVDGADDGPAASHSSSTSAVGLCVAFGPSNRHALVGLKDGRLLLFDLGSGDLLEAHDAHSSALWSIAVRPDETGCMTGSADKEVKFWDFDLTPAAVAAGPQTGGAAAGGQHRQRTGVLTLVHIRTLKLNDEVLCVRYSRSKDPATLLVAVALLDCTVKVRGVCCRSAALHSIMSSRYRSTYPRMPLLIVTRRI